MIEEPSDAAGEPVALVGVGGRVGTVALEGLRVGEDAAAKVHQFPRCWNGFLRFILGFRLAARH